MRAAALSIVLRMDSMSCLSTLSMCSGDTTKRARSASVKDIGGVDTTVGGCDGSKALAARAPARVTGPAGCAALGAEATTGGGMGLVGESDSMKGVRCIKTG
eukprot:1355285-Pleurochrysis_carterae.AAC.8